MRTSISWKVFLIFSGSLIIIISSQILTFYLYFRQDVTSQNVDLLYLQNKSIESLSRKFLQVTLLSNSNRDNSFNIFNLNLNIERDIKQINESAEIMLKGGIMLVDGKRHNFPQLDKKYHDKIKNIRLLLNAFMFVKDIILKSDNIAERENKLVLLTSIIRQLTSKNQSILRSIKKEVKSDQLVFTVVMIVALVIVIIVFLFFRHYIVGNIINPLKNFSERFVNLSEGFIGTEIEYIRKDEFGELYNSFNIFIRILKGITYHFKTILTDVDGEYLADTEANLMKPIQINELFLRINRVLKVRNIGKDREPSISISDKNNIYFFPPDKIIYISSSSKKTIIHTVNKDHALSIQFKDIEGKLNESFVRIHKQYIINTKFISRLTHIKSGHYKILLDDEDDTELPVGRSYIYQLKEKIQRQ